MAYSTAKMVRQALVPSSDGTQPSPPAHNAADMADAQLEDAIAEADSTIDGYLAARYTVPVAPVATGGDEDGTPVGSVPHPVDYWSRSIAAYNATLIFRGSQDFTDTDPIARRYRDVMTQLQSVSAGKITLNLPTSVTVAAGVGAAAPFNPYQGDLWQPSDFHLGFGNDLRPDDWWVR